MRKTCFLAALTCLLACGYQENASASILTANAQNLSDWSALSGVVEHPSGNYGAEGAIGGEAGYDYVWNLNGSFSNALVVISTDHVASASELFSFDVAGFDGSSWISGAFTGKVFTVGESELDPEDFATQWSFGSSVRRIGVTSGGTMALSDGPGSDYNAEFDGVNTVPEPSSIMLIGSGIAGMFFFRRRFKD